jgi:PAS domain S-box-containing protein
MENDSEAALAELLIEQAPDAIIFAGTDGMIRTWNAAATTMFGFAAGEAIGQSLDIIIPEPFRERHWTAYDRALEAGDTKYRGQSLPTRAQRKGGEQFYVELGFAIVHDPGGAVIGALAHARDITARFETERTARRHLREVEAELATLRGGAGLQA